MVRTPVSGDYEDRYLAKLIKYIPAEVLALFVPLVALADKLTTDRDLWMWATIGLGVVATIGYNRWQATDGITNQVTAAHGPSAPEEQRWSASALQDEIRRLTPAWYFYPLSVLAFGTWAVATAAPARALLHVDQALAEYLLAAVTFALPLADITLKHATAQVAAWRVSHAKPQAGPGVAAGGGH